MSKLQKILIVTLRVAFGIFFLYSGFTKLMDPAWTSSGYLTHAANFNGLFNWLGSGSLLPIVDFVNVWGQILLGASLVLGLFVCTSTILGAILMLLYYLPLPFPKQDAHSFIIDQHILYGLSLLVLGFFESGKTFGLDKYLGKKIEIKK